MNDSQKHVICILFLALWQAIFAGSPVYARSEERPNNKFGIHLAQPQDEDIERAHDLVNSHGGDWGYITLVIQENDRDLHKWQDIFEKLRERHLIPIIRLATQPDKGNWRRPDNIDIPSWIQFLNKLHWVVENRYIILFNEPNHATEWGGEVDARNYASFIKEFASQLKTADTHFFIMPGGLDASAPSQLPQYEDEEVFLREMVRTIGKEYYNKLFDGLASHSYPNPGFVGRANSSGRGTVRTYQWEQLVLDSMGIKRLPVFITETGWDGARLGHDEVARRFEYAYQYIWLPDNIVYAVTPFILNYQTEPFLQFSWVRPGNDGVYPEYETIQSMLKLRGDPYQEERGTISYSLPKEIVVDSTYHFQIQLQNAGQAIWSKDFSYQLMLDGLEPEQYIISSLGTVKPYQKRTIDVYLNTHGDSGEKQVFFVLYKKGREILKSEAWKYTVVPLPSLKIQASLFPKLTSSADDIEIQLFDEYEEMIFRKKGIVLEKGEGIVDQIENVALGQKYRVVLLKTYYLPRQTYVTLTRGENMVQFERMLPFDFNADGAFTFSDLPAVVGNISLFRNLTP